MTTRVPPSAAPGVFSAEQWQRIYCLLNDLDERQTLWLSGYLTSVSSGLPACGSFASEPEKVETPLLIAHGGETGNSAALANLLIERCRSASIPAKIANLDSFRARNLKREHTVLVICSTHGDGDPPEPCQAFYDELMGETAPKLDHLQFAVLALGDSSYEQYCQTGKEIDIRLSALGATRFAPRRDCDVDFEIEANTWMQNILTMLSEQQVVDNVEGDNQLSEELTAKLADAHTKNNPYECEVLENTRLSKAERHSPIHHIALSLDTTEFPVKPGDAIGVLTHNSNRLVSAILAATNLHPDHPVSVKGTSQPLSSVLQTCFDLVVPGIRLLEHWAHWSGSAKLVNLLDEGKKLQREFLRDHQVLDILSQFRASPNAQDFVACLRPLQPRLYDLANARPEADGELQILVKKFHYAFSDREEIGVASDFLCSRKPGDTILVYPHRNARFHLPNSSETPLLLIADGTGIAPYRAFIQELGEKSSRNPCWLIFSEQHYSEDFLYQLDWQKALANDHLKFVDTAFYCDDTEQDISDPIIRERNRFIDWMNQGAHIYLCGDKSKLNACETQLRKIYEHDLSMGNQQNASPNWKQIAADRRIHRNLY